MWASPCRCSGRGGGDRGPQHLCCLPGLQAGSEDWQAGHSQAETWCPRLALLSGCRRQSPPTTGRRLWAWWRGPASVSTRWRNKCKAWIPTGAPGATVSEDSPKMEPNQTSSLTSEKRVGSGNPRVCAHGPWRRAGSLRNSSPPPPPLLHGDLTGCPLPVPPSTRAGGCRTATPCPRPAASSTPCCCTRGPLLGHRLPRCPGVGPPPPPAPWARAPWAAMRPEAGQVCGGCREP